MLLFLLVQYASVVHAAEHDFHISEVVCDALIAAEKNDLDQLTAVLTFENTVLSEQLSVSLVALYLDDRFSVYRSRAPPAHIS